MHKIDIVFVVTLLHHQLDRRLLTHVFQTFIRLVVVRVNHGATVRRRDSLTIHDPQEDGLALQ